MKQLLTIFFFFSALFSGFCASGGSIQKLEKRLNLYPSNLKLRYVLSRAYASQGKDNPRYFDKSIQQLEEIIRVKQIPVVKFYLGLVFARKGNLDRAIYHWLTVVRSLKPNNLTTLRYLALAFEKKGKHSDSLKYWNKILSINPEDYKAHYHTALVTLKNLSVDESLRYSTAIRHFNKVISKYPSHPKSLYYLQATYRSSRQYLKQRKVLNRLLVMNPKNDKIRREFQLNKENLKRQPQDQVLKRPEPIPVKVVTEITDEDFQAAFKSDPEAHEVPEDHEPEAVHKNPTLPLDSPLSADAEILFNQGVTYLQNKEYDLALFNFLQAQELDPKFAQCYLQIGEVYLKLSDSTPTEEKFSEHLRLSRQSLTTAVELEPDSLLAHASRAKLKLVDQKEKEGFEVAHMKVARDAIQNGNTLFAIEEFIILITNNFVPMELVFALRDLINDVDEGTRLDLNNVLQPLIADGSPQGLYLGACLRIQRDFGEGLHLIDQIFDSKQSPTEFFRDLKARADRGNADFLDHYLLGRYLLKKEAFGAAKKHLEEAIKLAPDDAQKKKLEFYRDKAGSAGPSKIFTPIAIHGDKKPPFERFDREKADLISAEPSFSSVFKADASMGLLGAKKEFLERFLLEKSKNAVGNFLLGLIYQQSSLESTLQKAEELKIEAVESYPSDSGWHLSMGILSLRLGDSSYTQKFFQQSRAILLRKGWESYEPYAKVIGSEAAVQIGLSKLGRARELIRSGFQFNPHSRQV
ncbi:tetratricopeptide repeat protein, partial [bacterium]|nr:tetratricopeptide repeat protein [bacterium]